MIAIILFAAGLALCIPMMIKITQLDESYKGLTVKDFIPAMLCMAGFVMLSIFKTDIPAFAGLFAGISTAFLVCAAVCDKKTTEVPDALYIVPAALSVIYYTVNYFNNRAASMFAEKTTSEMLDILGDWAGIVIFILIQVLVLSRVYGMSDSLAFSTCALIGKTVGANEYACIAFMALTFCVFTVVQVRNKNIGKNLKLIQPKPLIPYIASIFWIALAFCRMIQTAI